MPGRKVGQGVQRPRASGGPLSPVCEGLGPSSPQRYCEEVRGSKEPSPGCGQKGS